MEDKDPASEPRPDPRMQTLRNAFFHVTRSDWPSGVRMLACTVILQASREVIAELLLVDALTSPN